MSKQECPRCKEIELALEPSTAAMYIQEWYCECGYFECRKNMTYSEGCRLSDEEHNRLDNEKQQWWQSLDADEVWIKENG